MHAHNNDMLLFLLLTTFNRKINADNSPTTEEKRLEEHHSGSEYESTDEDEEAYQPVVEGRYEKCYSIYWDARLPELAAVAIAVSAHYYVVPQYCSKERV